MSGSSSQRDKGAASPRPEALPGDGWIPTRVLFQRRPPQVEWAYTGDTRFTDPFVHETIQRTAGARRHRTDERALRHYTERAPGLEPSGFILHMSRCGSTVITRALGSDPHNRVLAEPDVIDDVFALEHYQPELDDNARAEWLRWMIAAMSRPLEGEERFFIKFNSLALTYWPLLRRVFPNTPIVFIFREPLEILASHLLDQAAFMRRDYPPRLVGLSERIDGAVSREEHMARVLAALGRSALDAIAREDDRVLLLDYSELPAALETRVYPFLGLPLTHEDALRLAPVLKVHAKSPQRRFRADGALKQSVSSAALRQAAATWLDPIQEAMRAERDRRG